MTTDSGAPTERFQRIPTEPKTLGASRPEFMRPMPPVEVTPRPGLAVTEDTGLMRAARMVAQLSVIVFCLCFAGLCVLGTWKVVELMGLPW